MDINKINNLLQPESSSPRKVDENAEFRRIFDRTLSKIDATPPPVPVDDTIDVIEHGDKILNLLDDFAKALSDPAKTLKEIEPLAATIEKETGLIEAEASDNLRQDKELGKIIRDLAVAANVAVLKFHRGDYV